jgi:hypothetical protein
MAHGYIGDDYGIDGGVNSDRDEDRGREWRERRQARSEDWHDRGRARGMMFGGGSRDWSEEGRERDHGRSSGRSFSANPDDHYRSWRDGHMSELDRDYQDYCREREQAFHQDFDAWRQQRHASYQPLQTGMTNSGLSHDPSGEVQVETEGSLDQTDPTGAATLGTNESPETRTGRGRR